MSNMITILPQPAQTERVSHWARVAVFTLLTLILVSCSHHQPIKGGDAAHFNWQAEHDKDHVMVGQWYDTRQSAYISYDQVQAAVAQTDLLLLGEKHDHPDHHHWQANFLAQMPEGSQVLMEMLEPGQLAAARLLTAGMSGEQIAESLNWANSGWPDFALYQPVFEAALNRQMTIRPANAARDLVRQASRQGLAVLDPGFVAEWQLDRPLAGTAQDRLEQDINDSHCGYLPAEVIPNIALAQRLRDASMAENVRVALQNGKKTALVAGNGHVRNDRGVPALLKQQGITNMLSVGLLEVDNDARDIAEYSALWDKESLPFDIILFTPVVDPADPCEKYRHMFKKQ